MKTTIKELKEAVGKDAEHIIAREIGLERRGTKYRCPNWTAHKMATETPPSRGIVMHCSSNASRAVT